MASLKSLVQRTLNFKRPECVQVDKGVLESFRREYVSVSKDLEVAPHDKVLKRVDEAISKCTRIVDLESPLHGLEVLEHVQDNDRVRKLSIAHKELKTPQAIALAEALLRFPITSKLNLCDNLLNEDAAAALLACMRSQMVKFIVGLARQLGHDSNLAPVDREQLHVERASSTEVPSFSIATFLLKVIKLDGNGVRDDDLLRLLSEHEEFGNTLNLFAEVRYAFESSVRSHVLGATSAEFKASMKALSMDVSESRHREARAMWARLNDKLKSKVQRHATSGAKMGNITRRKTQEEMNAGRERHESMYGFRIPWHEYLPFALERIATNDGVQLAFTVDDLINVAAVYVVNGLDAAVEESTRYLPAPKSDAWTPLFKSKSRFCSEADVVISPLAAAHATSPKDEYRLAMGRAQKRRIGETPNAAPEHGVEKNAAHVDKDAESVAAAAAAAAILSAAATSLGPVPAAVTEGKEGDSSDMGHASGGSTQLGDADVEAGKEESSVDNDGATTGDVESGPATTGDEEMLTDGVAVATGAMPTPKTVKVPAGEDDTMRHFAVETEGGDGISRDDMKDEENAYDATGTVVVPKDMEINEFNDHHEVAEGRIAAGGETDAKGDSMNDASNRNDDDDSESDEKNLSQGVAGEDAAAVDELIANNEYAYLVKIPGFKQLVAALKSRKVHSRGQRLGAKKWLKQYFFEKIDSDKSKTVSRKEIHTALGRVSIVVGEDTFDQLMDAFDKDASGEIDADDFTAALLPFFGDDDTNQDDVELDFETISGQNGRAVRTWETEAYDFSSQGLRRLVVDANAIAKDANNYWAPQVTRTLRVLNLSNNALSSLEVDLFLLPLLPNLEELDLSRNELTRLGTPAPLVKTKSIVTLSMSPATATSTLLSNSGVEEEKKNVPELTLFKNKAVFGFAPNLRSLNLEHNKIDSIATEAFAASTKIEVLLLGFNFLTEVQGLEMLKELQVLGFESNRISRVVQLRSLSLNTELVDLRLAGCPVMYGLAKRNRYKSSVTSLLPCLMKIDGVVLPPSSERKRLSRMQKAQHLRDMASCSSGRSPEFSGRNTPWRDINSEYEMMLKKSKASKARSAGVAARHLPHFTGSRLRKRSYTAVKRRGGRSTVGSERKVAPPRRKLVYAQGSGTIEDGMGNSVDIADERSSAFRSNTKSVSQLLSPHPTSVGMAAATELDHGSEQSLPEPELYNEKGERVPHEVQQVHVDRAEQKERDAHRSKPKARRKKFRAHNLFGFGGHSRSPPPGDETGRTGAILGSSSSASPPTVASRRASLVKSAGTEVAVEDVALILERHSASKVKKSPRRKKPGKPSRVRKGDGVELLRHVDAMSPVQKLSKRRILEDALSPLKPGIGMKLLALPGGLPEAPSPAEVEHHLRIVNQEHQRSLASNISGIPGFLQLVRALCVRKAQEEKKLHPRAHPMAVEAWLIKRFFDRYDMDHNRSMSALEFKRALARFSIVLGEQAFENLLFAFDCDGDGEIDPREFIETVAPYMVKVSSPNSRQASAMQPSSFESTSNIMNSSAASDLSITTPVVSKIALGTPAPAVQDSSEGTGTTAIAPVASSPKAPGTEDARGEGATDTQIKERTSTSSYTALEEKVNKLYQWQMMEIDLVRRQQEQISVVTAELSRSRASAAGARSVTGIDTKDESPSSSSSSAAAAAAAAAMAGVTDVTVADTTAAGTRAPRASSSSKSKQTGGRGSAHASTESVFQSALANLRSAASTINDGSGALKRGEKGRSLDIDDKSGNRLLEWTADMEQDMMTSYTALEMLMKMCEKGNYTSEMLNEYCARLADVELFEDSQVPAKAAELCGQGAGKAITTLCNHLSKVKAAVRELLDVMFAEAPSSSRLRAHTEEVMKSSLAHDLFQNDVAPRVSFDNSEGGAKQKAAIKHGAQQRRKQSTGKEIHTDTASNTSSTGQEHHHAFEAPQFDQLSVASSQWSLEANASVKGWGPKKTEKSDASGGPAASATGSAGSATEDAIAEDGDAEDGESGGELEDRIKSALED